MALFHIVVKNDTSELEGRLKRIEQHLKFLINELHTMAKVTDDIRAAIDEIKSAAENISADIDRLASQAEGGLTADEATAFVSELRDLGTTLRTVADKTPDGDQVPDVPETPTDPENPTPEEPA